MQAWEREPGGLVQPMHDVEALNSLTRCPLHEVVNCTNDDKSVTTGINLKADVAKIGPAQELWLRVTVNAISLLYDPDKGLLRIVFPKYCPDFFFFPRLI